MFDFFRRKEEEKKREKPLVLHIDDDLDIRAVISVTLGTMGLDVASSPSGEKGLESALASRPDLIILDIRMPGLDGIELCKRLKAQARTKDIPVLMLTAMGQNRDVELALAAGAAAYIVKPLEAKKFKAKVRELLKLPA